MSQYHVDKELLNGFQLWLNIDDEGDIEGKVFFKWHTDDIIGGDTEFVGSAAGNAQEVACGDGSGVGTILMVALALVKRGKDPYVSIPHLISSGVNWELVILIASTMPISNALEAEEAGVLQSVIAWMNQTFSGLSGLTFLIVVTVVFLLVTQVTHNLVLIIVFTPVLTKMGLSFGVEPALVMFLIFYAAMAAYATPAASSNAALIFGNDKWVARKDGYASGAIMLLASLIVLVCIAIPLGQVML